MHPAPAAGQANAEEVFAAVDVTGGGILDKPHLNALDFEYSFHLVGRLFTQ